MYNGTKLLGLSESEVEGHHSPVWRCRTMWGDPAYSRDREGRRRRYRSLLISFINENIMYNLYRLIILCKTSLCNEVERKVDMGVMI